jgi:hypothetical protein
MQTKRSTPTDNAPHPFIQKYQADVIGILHGFDRLRFQGTLRCLYHRNSMEAYLQQAKVLYKDFKSFATGITSRIHESARQIAQAAGRPFRYLPSSQVRKEEEAKESARQDKIEAGLIAVLSCVEPCRTYFMRGNRQSKHLELKLERGKCLHFYFYQYHPLFGFMYASDVMFREAATLRRLYPRIVHHAITSFGSTEVLRFLGRRASDDGGSRTGRPFEGEVTSDMRQRHEGIRVKHRRDTNSIKIYDKQGSVLRTETIINNPRDFQVYRASENAPEGEKTWRILRRGVADLYRRAEICQAANQRYLSALAAVSAGAPLGEEAARVCAPVRQHGRRHRALNPLWLEDATLLQAVNRGEFALDGLRNRDLRALLWDGSTCDKKTNRRRAAAVTRKLRLLRAHGLLRKVSHTHRYVVTDQGRRIITALLSALKADVEQLAKMAA